MRTTKNCLDHILQEIAIKKIVTGKISDKDKKDLMDTIEKTRKSLKKLRILTKNSI